MIRDTPSLAGYPHETGLLCAVLQDTTVDWRGEIHRDLGPEATTWRARPGGPSIGAIMLHMIVAELFWFEEFFLGVTMDGKDRQVLMPDEVDVYEPRWPEAPAQPLTWYFDLHDKYRARTLEAIRRWPAPDFLKDREGEPDLYSPRWVLGHVIQHEAYHGGQIVMMVDLWENRRSQ